MSVRTLRTLSGCELPRLAFGTGTALYKAPVKSQVLMALNAGFNFIDCADTYDNEESAGQAIEQFLSTGVKREDIYVLTKVGGEGMKDLPNAVREAMRKLKVDYLDGYLMHLPPRGKDDLPSNVDAWKQMEKIKDEGLSKSIGVSNWLASDIQQVLDASPKHIPEINQIEFHPYCYAHEEYQKLMALQKKHSITTMTYSALGPLYKDAMPESGPLHKALTQIADKNEQRTPANVLLRWAFQRSGGIITTTTNKESRAKEYLDQIHGDNDKYLELSESELTLIDDAGREHGVEKYYMAPFLKP